METNWIQTEGTPLIIIPEKYVHLWNGMEGDYQYAVEASFEDYITKITLNGSDFLVLGDESMLTFFYKIGQYDCIIRWKFAPNMISAQNNLKLLEIDNIPIIEQLPIHIAPGNLYLFDSSERFSHDIEYLKISNKIAINKILTREYYNKQENVSFIIHQLSY